MDTGQFLLAGNESQLAGRGWDMTAVYDVCWLDCELPGYRRVWRGRHICLCRQHAAVLENGCWSGDYRGAPLPRGSIATAWPWLSLDTAVA